MVYQKDDVEDPSYIGIYRVKGIVYMQQKF